LKLRKSNHLINKEWFSKSQIRNQVQICRREEFECLPSHQDDHYCKLNVAISAIIIDHCAKSRSELSLIYARHFRFGESCATRFVSRLKRDATGNLPLSGTVCWLKVDVLRPFFCKSELSISYTLKSNHNFRQFSFIPTSQKKSCGNCYDCETYNNNFYYNYCKTCQNENSQNRRSMTFCYVCFTK